MSLEFAVRTASGRFTSIGPNAVMTLKGLAAFKEAAVSVPGPNGVLLRDKIVPLLESLPIQDDSRFTPKTSADDLRLDECGYQSGFAAVTAPCLVLAHFMSESITFQPRSHAATIFTHDPSSWGWEAAARLMAHEKLIKTHAAQCRATVRMNVLRNAAKHHDELTCGSVYVRFPDTAADLAQHKSYAVYSPSAGGYANVQWTFGSLAGARLFESAETAQRAAERARHNNLLQVVELDMTITRAVSQVGAPNGAQKHPIEEALVLIQRRQLEQALEQADVAALRARLTQLEGQPQDVPIPRKKM